MFVQSGILEYACNESFTIFNDRHDYEACNSYRSQ